MTYQEKIRELERLNPAHPLLRIFRLAENAGNDLLLSRELEKAGFDAEECGELPEETGELPPIDVDDEVLRGLHRDQATLYGERRKISNEFHDCFTDRQRIAVSERIQVVQSRIEIIREKIRVYRMHGRVVEDEKYPIPEDPFRLLALEKSLLSSRSRKSREIREIGESLLAKAPGAQEKLDRAEAKMREIETHLTHVRQKIKTRNIQPGAISQG